MVPWIKLWSFVESWQIVNVSETHNMYMLLDVLLLWITLRQKTGELLNKQECEVVTEYAGENLSNENKILIGVPCEMCENCGVLALEVQEAECFITVVHFPNFFVPESLKWEEGKEREEKGKISGKEKGRMTAPKQLTKWAGSQHLVYPCNFYNKLMSLLQYSLPRKRPEWRMGILPSMIIFIQIVKK